MKHKYVMISGFAFGEKADMKKLKRLASQGWILEGLTPFFYKLRKGEPANIDYSLDYRSDYDEEYFKIFQEAGWIHRATHAGEMHIFSAPEGTTPLYLDPDEQSEQYLPMIKGTAKGSASSFAISCLLATLWHFIGPTGWISDILMALWILVWIVFVFNFLPCMGFLFRRIRMARQAR